MKTMMSLLATAVVAAATATPAAAQVPGTYAGTTADGESVSFIVSTDPNTGAYALSSASINFAAPCKNQDYTIYTGWGFGLEADIVNRKVLTVQTDNYYYFDINLTFAADGQSAKGTLESISPTLYNATGATKPNTTLICTSPKQALTLTLQPSSDSSSAAKPNQQQIRRNSKSEAANSAKAAE
jgi:hypothetical protein